MIPFYFADRRNGIVGVVGRRQVASAKRTENIKTGRAYIEITLRYRPQHREKLTEITKPGNYILTKGHSGPELYGIMTCTQLVAERTIEIYAEDIGLDIINQVAPAYSSEGPKSIVFYLSLFAPAFTIRANEVSNLTRTLEWDRDSTAAERLASIAASFGAEIAFGVDVKGLDVKSLYIDIYRRRGHSIAKPLRVGREIREIMIERAADKVATAILATGRDGLTLAGKNYDDGDIYLDVNTHVLISRAAEAEWSYQWVEPLSGKEILRLFEVDTESKDILLTQAVRKLNAIKKATKTYKVTANYLPEDLRLGDVTRITSSPDELTMEARLVELSVEKTTGRIEAEFDDIKEVDK